MEFLHASLLWARCLLLWRHFKRGQSFMDAFSFSFFFPSKSDCISQGTALEPQTARVAAWDSYGWSQADALEGWFILAHESTWTHRGRYGQGWSMVHTHAHTNTQCAPCLDVPLHVNNDTRTPPSSCQSLSAWVGGRQRRKTETLRVSCLLTPLVLVRWKKQNNKMPNDRSSRLNIVPSRLTHFQLCWSEDKWNFPTHPKTTIFCKAHQYQRHEEKALSDCHCQCYFMNAWGPFALELTHPITMKFVACIFLNG